MRDSIHVPKVGDMRVSSEQFERIVWDAIDELPEALRNRISNLEIEVKMRATKDDLDYSDTDDPDELFGLYRGVPLTERDTHYDMALPDLITIFQRPHELECRTLDEMREEVRRTVRHEIAHHFGIGDERLDELGAY
jgi:predicted Zn-dependent protease with MMP-like domain